MGRGNKKRSRGGRGAAPQSTRPYESGRPMTQNAKMDGYYQAQNLFTDPEDWTLLWETMRRELPVTFRVGASRVTAQTINDTIKDSYVPLLTGLTFEGDVVQPPRQIPWYPGGFAWQFDVTKKVLRRSPEFKKFHSFLVFETEVGNISRQEAVSMLPPLFLDVKPHHKVLDMCAAPGSKTAQLLEALHTQPNTSPSALVTPTGLLIANDSDNKRTHLLIHQSARLPSPAFMVTNVDASLYPTLQIASSHDENVTVPLLFDRILCDVPCSGDGTLRKNFEIWKKWTYMDGNGLHGLQLRILTRGMRLLAPGGRLVYSTCSMNPVENEAVIAAALNSLPDFELVDVSSQLPELIRRPGLHTWTPAVGREGDLTCKIFEDYKGDANILRSIWPPSAEVAQALHLERCIRVYPHFQDTGGFFVAVLERKQKASQNEGERKREAPSPTPVPGEPEAKKIKLDTDSITGGTIVSDTVSAPADKPKFNRKPKKENDGSFKELPYTYLDPKDPALEVCQASLKLLPSFPASDILVRAIPNAPIRTLYLTTPLVHAVIKSNNYTRMRLMTAGTKVFTRQDPSRTTGAAATDRAEDSDAEVEEALNEVTRPDIFRILGEGLPVILPWIREETIVIGDVKSLRILIGSYYPLCRDFEGTFAETITNRETGSIVLRFPKGVHEGVKLTHDLFLPIWKSSVSVTLMIDKKSKSAMSLRLFGEDLTPAGKDAAKAAVIKNEAKAIRAENYAEADVEDGPIEMDTIENE